MLLNQLFNVHLTHLLGIIESGYHDHQEKIVQSNAEFFLSMYTHFSQRQKEMEA